MAITKKNKISFIYNSNLIEEINFPFELYELWVQSNISEIQGHASALDYVLENYKKELTESRILKIHRLLTNGLLSDNESGHYRKCNVYIGGAMGSMPIAIKPEMMGLVAMCRGAKSHIDCWDCHHEFEMIHPFVDGNGRVGRLILNWLLLHNKKKFEIINIEDRFEYYNKIKKYRFYRALSWDFKKIL